ncbi:Butirosin biosynthesis, BtrG-like protein [Nemania sp. FL0916]|nr:Butirosin biosynthesis, BtrG-like protein [Nemania sp. FL0916]
MASHSGQLYFAYGSNLWLRQMALRCPGSVYIGRAILYDYRWFINERGYANIEPASGHAVHGLVYEINSDDESALDMMEGVSFGAYTKEYLQVSLYAVPDAFKLDTQQLLIQGNLREFFEVMQTESNCDRELEPRLKSSVLVYMSTIFNQYGESQDEYIDRMNGGIRDAIDLGIPREYIEDAIRPSIPDRQ